MNFSKKNHEHKGVNLKSVSKKLILGVIFVFATISSVNADNESYLYNDDYCFDRAIEHLQDMESVFDITYSQGDATDILNEEFMICWCLSHMDYCMDSW